MALFPLLDRGGKVAEDLVCQQGAESLGIVRGEGADDHLERHPGALQEAGLVKLAVGELELRQPGGAASRRRLLLRSGTAAVVRQRDYLAFFARFFRAALCILLFLLPEGIEIRASFVAGAPSEDRAQPKHEKRRDGAEENDV